MCVCAIFVRGVKLGGQNVHDTKNLRRVQVNMDQSVQNHDGERRFKCLYCGKQYKHRSHLTYHTTRKHTPEKRKWRCSICGLCYLTRDGFVSHLRSKLHTEKAKCRFECDFCKRGKATLRQLSLNIISLDKHYFIFLVFLSSSGKILHEYSAHTTVPENSAHTSVPEDQTAQPNSGGAHWRPWEAKTESADCQDRQPQEGGGALSSYEVEAATILLHLSKK